MEILPREQIRKAVASIDLVPVIEQGFVAWYNTERYHDSGATRPLATSRRMTYTTADGNAS
jgi:hypothetical protein